MYGVIPSNSNVKADGLPLYSSVACDRADALFCHIVLAPGQSKIMHYKVSTLPIDELTFTIGYKCLDKYYEEVTTLNVKKYAHIPVPRPESYISEGSERQVQTLREIVERLI